MSACIYIKVQKAYIMIVYTILMGQKASHRQYRDNDSGLLPSQAHVLVRWKVKFSSPLRRAVVTTKALNNAKGDSFPPGTKATGASKCSFISIERLHKWSYASIPPYVVMVWY